jgi:hypothetical protein
MKLVCIDLAHENLALLATIESLERYDCTGVESNLADLVVAVSMLFKPINTEFSRMLQN